MSGVSRRPAEGLCGGSPHNTFHTGNQALRAPEIVYLERIYSSRGPAVIS